MMCPPRGPPPETLSTGARKGFGNGGRLRAGGRCLVGTQTALLGVHPGQRRGISGRQVKIKVTLAKGSTPTAVFQNSVPGAPPLIS